MKNIHVFLLFILTEICLCSAFAQEHMFKIEKLGEPQKLTYNRRETHPSVVKIPNWVQRKPHPNAKYLMYTGIHGSPGNPDLAYIRCYWAESPLGSWTPVEGLENHLQARQVGNWERFSKWEMASPDVHIDHENKRFIMFFHGTFYWHDQDEPRGHCTSVATSPDGLDWGDPENIDPVTGLKKVKEIRVAGPYFRYFEHKGNKYGIAQGLSQATNRQTQLLRKDSIFKKWHEGSNLEIRNFNHTQWRNFGVLVRGDYLINFHCKIEDAPERIKATVFHMKSEHLKDWELLYQDNPIEVHEPTARFEIYHHKTGKLMGIGPSRPGAISGALRQLRGPYVFEDKDEDGNVRTYLYYAWNGEWGIAGFEIKVSRTDSTDPSDPPQPNSAPVINNLTATSTSVGLSPEISSISVAATDAEGDELAYSWFVTGPGGYNIENGTSNVEASFQAVGTYTVTVEVSDGKLSSTKSIEIKVETSVDNKIFTDSGVLEVTQENSQSWKTVELSQEYVDPVIIMSPLTFNGSQPAVVRVKNVTNNSFDFQIEEWDYLDGSHIKEKVQYIVLEAGVYDLSEERKLIAGNINASDNFSLKYFNEELKDDVPVVLTQIITENDTATAAVRLQNVSYESFEIKLQSQESFNKTHDVEKVSFLAIDSGTYNELGIIAAGKITDKVKHKWFQFDYNEEFVKVPSFFASIQTTKGEDPVALRMKAATEDSVNIKLEEEQSKDKEINHAVEDIGYILIDSE